MTQTLFLYGLYVYILYTIVFFVLNIRNGAFVRMTILYYIVITTLICLLLYGSAYYLEWNYTLWHQWDQLAPFPITLTNGGLNANTITKTGSLYWFWTIVTTSFYLTFPQSVARSANLHLGESETTRLHYLREMPYLAKFAKFRDSSPLLQSLLHLSNVPYIHKILVFLKGTPCNVFNISEGFFSLIILVTSSFSPYVHANWLLMLPCFYFIVLISGYDLSGLGPVSIILKLFAPTILYKMQQIAVWSLKAAIALFSVGIGYIAALIPFNVYLNVTHQQTASVAIIILSVVVGVAAIYGSFVLLFKVITFPLKKAIDALGIRVFTAEDVSSIG